MTWRDRQEQSSVLMVGPGFGGVGLAGTLVTTGGCEVRIHTASDGPAAFDFLSRAVRSDVLRPALVLIELGAAGSGLSMVNRLKEAPAFSCLPVIVLGPSGVDAEGVREQILDFWFDVALLPLSGCTAD